MKITNGTDNNLSKIYINGILHIAFVRTKFLSLQSWKDFDKHTVELVFSDNKITLEYADFKLWVKILKELEKVLYP